MSKTNTNKPVSAKQNETSKPKNVKSKPSVNKSTKTGKSLMKKNAHGERIPKTAQDTVPYLAVHKDGLIETKKNFFTRAYELNDVNFSVAPNDEQEKIFDNYLKLLNSFDGETKIQIIVNNANTNEELLLQDALIAMQYDKNDIYREEMNAMIKDKLSEGRNNIVSRKYLIIGSDYPSAKEAHNNFIGHVDIDVDQAMKAIAQTQNVSTRPMTAMARLQQLHDILNIGNENQFNVEQTLEDIAKKGLTTKDLVTASGYRFDRDCFIMGDKYARVLYFKDLPNRLSTDFMRSVAELPFNLTASFYMQPIPVDKATALVNRHLQNIRSNVIDAQKQASKSGYSADLISPELISVEEQAQFLLDDVKNRDQKLFYFTGVIMCYADSKEELEKQTKSIISMSNRYMVVIDKLYFQQEHGFRNALPLCRNDVAIRRLMTSESVSLFIPFSTKELIQKNGMYYGLNAVSKNLLLYNRLNAKNQNGLIIGQPGSGKSFSAKREMINVFLSTKDEVYIIDPEAEYSTMVKRLGGSVVHFEAGSKVYINPFDMDIQYGDDEDNGSADPVTMKSDYICMLCETAMGGKYEITNVQKSIIDRCVIALYRPYLEHMRLINQNAETKITCDVTATPTMDDFYELLMQQPEAEAQNIALSLEIYCRGSLDTFAHRTNVDITNRLTSYDIKDIGSGMKEMGLQVCLNHVWNQIISNQRAGKRTWLYIDEFHILTKTRSSSEFVEQIWRRARKWGGLPTAITQNVRDLFQNEAALTILSNCEFIMMLSQAPADRVALAEMYKISDAQLSYITNSPPGQGLLYVGDTIVPFVDHFPKETELYKIMSSKADERL